MQLDRTNVVVRARSMAEIADLAMVLIRVYPKSVIVAFVLGALPWFIANWLLLGHLVIVESDYLDYGLEYDDYSRLWLYQFGMLLLVFLQTPIAGALTTVSIGRSVFESQPTLRAAWHDARSHFWRWFWVLGVLRGPIPAMSVISLYWFNMGQGIGTFFLCLMFGIYGLLRSMRPFMPEIVLLERCPLRIGSNQDQLTVSKRAVSLHRPISGDCFGRFLVTSLLAIIIATCVFCAIMLFRGVLFNWWGWGRDVYLVYYPVSLWIAAGFTVIVRFLSYLDARIRLEGWEVQLAVMAETIRQFGSVDVVTSGASGSSRPTQAIAGGTGS